MGSFSSEPSLWRVLVEDWRVNVGLLERSVVVTYRLRHAGVTRAPRAVWRPLALALMPLEFVLRTMIGGQISARSTFGRRLRIPHAWGIVVHPTVVAGDDCIMYHQVTIGMNEHRSLHEGPRLGDRVYIGAGAKIIGAITIGDRVNIGANAVVVSDVPSDHVAVGVPALCKPRRDRTEPVAHNHEKSG